MRKKLAIVGFSEKSRDFAPYDDPEWEIWGCNHVYRFVPRVDVNFELHRLKEVETKLGPEKWKVYSDWLRTTKARVWMQDESPDFPNVHRFPIEKLEREFSYFLEHVEYTGTGVGDRKVTKRERKPYAQFKSTLSYMLAMAIWEGRFEEIAVYGVDMAVDSEWHFQRMNFSFLLGWCRGAGIRLVIPDVSALLMEAGVRLYAYEGGTADKYKTVIDHLGKRVQELDQKMQKGDLENEELIRHMFRLEGIVSMLKVLSAEEHFNGHREYLSKELRDHELELLGLKERQRVHLQELTKALGARSEAYALMDRLGYHNRGEMPEGRA